VKQVSRKSCKVECLYGRLFCLLYNFKLFAVTVTWLRVHFLISFFFLFVLSVRLIPRRLSSFLYAYVSENP
jgi:hypothetical protein